MKPERMDRILLKLIYLDAAAVVVLQTLGLDALVSALFTLTFPLTVLLWLRSVREKLTVLDLLALLTVFLAAVSVLLDALGAGAVLTVSYGKKLVIFAMTLLLFQAMYRFDGSADVAGLVKRLGDILTLWFLGMYLLQRERMFYIGGRLSGYLTFGFTNPNLAAMVLSCLYMLQGCRLFGTERKRRAVHLGLAAVLMFFLWQTRSRNCLLAAAVFTAGWVLLAFCKGKRLWVPGWLAATVSVLPGLFVAGYLGLVSMEEVPEFVTFFLGEGKRLDSRMAVWGPALEALRDSPIIGAYCRISGGAGSSQMHNSHLDIAASYGVPVLALVCLLLGVYLYQGGREYPDRERFCDILAFGCCLLLGLGEAAVFSGGLGIYLFAGMFLLLAKGEETA